LPFIAELTRAERKRIEKAEFLKKTLDFSTQTLNKKQNGNIILLKKMWDFEQFCGI